MDVKEYKGYLQCTKDLREAFFICCKENISSNLGKKTHGWSRLSLHIELGLKFMHLIHKNKLQNMSFVPLYH